MNQLTDNNNLDTDRQSFFNNCPGTLAEGYNAYSRSCLDKVFNGKKVSPILPYNSPAGNADVESLFAENCSHISISGVQEKFSVVLEKNKLRLARDGERGMYILKPVPRSGKRADQMPANEHLTMQIASQVFGIETAPNALVFFRNNEPAYITKRFDMQSDGSKLAQDDFASLAGRMPQTHGEHYKYAGNYLEMFQLLQRYVPAYKIEAPKLIKILIFNYIMSNGDAHFKNFSLLETPLGDYRLSPAYDLLNSRIHIEDRDFALDDGLLPRSMAQGKISQQFAILAEQVGIANKIFTQILQLMLSRSDKVEKLIGASYLQESTKRSYLQMYQSRIKQLVKC